MLTQEELKYYLNYDPDTGYFTWRISNSNRSPVGSIIHNVCKNTGYVKIGLLGKRYQAHRLVWLYMFGKFPEKDIDHINNNRKDNRLCNLRECTRSENNYNRSPDKEKPSNTGLKGISYNKKWRRFDCGIKASNIRERKSFYVRDYTSKEEALHAAEAWVDLTRTKLQGNFARL